MAIEADIELDDAGDGLSAGRQLQQEFDGRVHILLLDVEIGGERNRVPISRGRAGVGGEIGYGPRQGYDNGLRIKRFFWTPSETGAGDVDEINSDGTTGLEESKQRIIAREGGDNWYGRYWLGELYPDDSFDVWKDVGNGVIKSIAFGFTVTFVALLQGFDAQPTPEGVSHATTRTVVVASLSVLGLDFVLTALMFSI